MIKTKPKTCRVCKAKYKPFSTTQVVCQPKCAIELVKQQTAKKAAADKKLDRKLTRERKLALKTRREWVKDLQKVFNEFIRERDHNKPCISCDHSGIDRRTLLTGSRWDCGHYRSVGSAPELRFCEFNAFRQCVKCNQHLSGNTVEYRKRLVGRIGYEKLEWLEGNHAPLHLTIDDIKLMLKDYRERIRELKAKRSR